ncbi:hypothetical protein ABID26_005603 [Mesorhizobium shonense]|uniref:Uncharacterized protein n=1 Tax=Mesorhizobium shonense TaxID=1209948 RepID=A0ABV2HZX6_9HYPH
MTVVLSQATGFLLSAIWRSNSVCPSTGRRRMLADTEQERRLLRHAGPGTVVAECGATSGPPYLKEM